MSKPVFHCEDCGDLDHALMDGYLVGERLIEGIKFELRIWPDGADGWFFVATTPKAHRDYMKTLNESLWTARVATRARTHDLFTCPKCGYDIPNPLLESNATPQV